MAQSSWLRYGLREARKDAINIVPLNEGARLKFYEGDHWQDGEAWIGPYPGQSTKGAGVYAEIERGFISRNAIKEVVDRFSGGLMGREPNWFIVPLEPKTGANGEELEPEDEIKAKITEAEAIITDWWDKKEVKRSVEEAVEKFALEGRGVIRLFIPRGKVPGGSIIPAPLGKNLKRYVWAENPTINSTAILEHKETKEEIAVHVWEEENAEYAEVSFLEDPDLEEQSKTIIRTFGKGGQGDLNLIGETAVALGGNLCVYEMTSDPLVTPQCLQLQKSINLSLTMSKENIIAAGFLERVIMNAEIPGKWIKDESGNEKFVPDPVKVGAGTTTYYTGVENTEESGATTVATPSIFWRKPEGVSTFKESVDLFYECILGETRQIFILLNREGNVSGASRKQARYDYVKSLERAKPHVDRLMRWLLSTALEMEATFAGRPGYFHDLKIISDVKLDAGPLTDEERAEIAKDYAAKLISRQTAMALLGVEDVDAEVRRILEELKTAPKPIEDLAKIGYALDPEQFPEVDESQGFKVRSLEEIQAKEESKAENERLAREAVGRANNPANQTEDDESEEDDSAEG